MREDLRLAENLKFHDLYSDNGLRFVDKKFNSFFSKQDSSLYQKFLALKNNPQSFSKKQHDDILINSARVLEDFIVHIFGIKKENDTLKNEHKKLDKIYFVKREFVQRIVAKKFNHAPQDVDLIAVLKGSGVVDLEASDNIKLSQIIISQFENITNFEIKIAEEIFVLLDKELNEAQKTKLELLTIYAACALYDEAVKHVHQHGSLFNLPQKIDYENLCGNVKKNIEKRDGFNLTDDGFNLNQTLSHANYCIFCHNQEKDSCRSGLKEKTTEKSETFKKNPLQIELKGCPLDQKISEMNLLKSEGFSIASIAVAAIDNPLLAGTGHRICNDCMKSCIFQKQDPVNIPQIETESLQDLLHLPWGFEIYSLLTRWNPLNFSGNYFYDNSLQSSQRSSQKKSAQKKILIAGLGPAGYTLAHYLLNQGHIVVAIDGLKIEPLNPQISGINEYGERKKFKPIKYIDEIYEPLSSRIIQGFGGVSEYGITVRWNKNFLTIIRLLLERRQNFRMFGGIRFGSSITDKTAFDLYGFDHVALCIGAGRPHIVNIKNNFAKGIRAASDFLMALQLSGAFKDELFTNLQIRAPIIVVGAGLTAVDTACEAQEYYFVQIRKFAAKFEILCRNFGEEKIWQQLNEEEKNIAKEFLEHVEILANKGKTALLKIIGATKILYRKKIQNSPAYKLNHEELIKAFEQGIEFVESEEIDEALLDDFGHIKAVKCKNGKQFKCASLLIAAGTEPNVGFAIEDGLDFVLQQKYMQSISKNSFITKIDEKGRAVSFFGDLHPNFEGNVVKAMASAKHGAKEIANILQSQQESTTPRNFLKKINQEFLVKISKINYISNYVAEVKIYAPLLAKQAQIGHIFRLQNYHNLAQKFTLPNSNLVQLAAMEGVPVTALDIDAKRGFISGVVTLYGASTSLIKNFKKNEPCIFMGPSGKPTDIAKNETVVLIGGGRGIIPLAAIAKAYKQNGCKIIFVAGYQKNSYLIGQKEIEKFSDIALFTIAKEAPKLKLKKPQSQQYQGTVIDAVKQYFANNQEKIDRIFTIGGNEMMNEIAKLRHENVLQNFSQAPIAITSLNAPMQCMLKGVCSQCLQKRKLENGEWEYFYSCAAQDQDMDKLDFAHLKARCEQNSLQEKIAKMSLVGI